MPWPLVAAAGIAAGASIYNQYRNEARGISNARREYQRQKEFAQHGIRWKVEDAKRAGIHPLAAMGANLNSYAPQRAFEPSSGFAQAGQSIARAISSKQTPYERELMRIKLAQERAILRGQNLNNELAAAQLSPPMPTLGGTPPEQLGNVSVDMTAVPQESGTHGGIRAGVHPSLTWKLHGNKLSLTRGPQATGIEEDPASLISDMKYMHELKRRSKIYAKKSNRSRPGYRRFLNEIGSLYPSVPPKDPRLTWVWSYKDHTFIKAPKKSSAYRNAIQWHKIQK